MDKLKEKYIKTYTETDYGYHNNATMIYGQLNDGNYYVYIPDNDVIDIYNKPITEKFIDTSYNYDTDDEKADDTWYNKFVEEHQITKNYNTDDLNLIISELDHKYFGEEFIESKEIEEFEKLEEDISIKDKEDKEDKEDIKYNIYILEGGDGVYNSQLIDTVDSEEQAEDRVAELSAETGSNAYYKKVINGKEEDSILDDDWDSLNEEKEINELQEYSNNEKELFSGIEFEKKIPNIMRFKQYDVLDDNEELELYWVTQQFFGEAELNEFVKALKETIFKKAYVTVRDLSTYQFNKDLENNVLVKIELNAISDLPYVDATGYTEAIKNNYNFDYKTGEWKDNLDESRDLDNVYKIQTKDKGVPTIELVKVINETDNTVKVKSIYDGYEFEYNKNYFNQNKQLATPEDIKNYKFKLN